MRPPSLRLQPFLSHARLFSSTPRLPVARITLVGRIGAEPELQPTSTGTDIVRYVIGTNSGPPDNRQTSWWRVAAFPNEGPSRDRLMGLAKGTLVYLEGSANMRTFDTADGKRSSALNISQNRLEVLKRPEGHSATDMSGESGEEEFASKEAGRGS